MIRTEKLTKDYGDLRAVDGLDFELFEGEVLGFLGPNGAGKTTTMRILTCFLPPSSGRAIVAGYDVDKEPNEVRRVIGYMPEGVPLYGDMTPTDFLDFVAHAKQFPRARRAKLVDAAIEETNLGDVRNRRIAELSKGYRQRVGLAQAILGEPKVLILDEPTSGLDPKQIAEVRTLIRNMAGRRTVILSTHILPEVQMTCSRVIIINRGRIVASGSPDRLASQARQSALMSVRLAAPRDEAAAVLRSLPGVVSVREQTLAVDDHAVVQPIEFHVESEASGGSLEPQAAAAIVAKGWDLLEVRPIRATLEDIFLEAVAGEPEAAAGAAASAEAAK